MDLWYKNAVIYCLDVETYRDGNGDGVGDFKGLTECLPHIATLGANCVWLLPFHPTPNRDNGYDITDYYGVDPRFGSPGDFVEFMHAAKGQGLRVIIDLVVNHTSVEHPWFRSARSSPDSPFRNWYIWEAEKPENADEGVVFPGVQESTWTYDQEAGAWYFHRFYKHQADLNVANPEVRREIERIMGFWLELGVSGFRIDAVPFLIEHQGDPPEGRENPHHLLTEMRDFLAWRKAGAIMLAEANITMDEAGAYFGNGDRMHLIFNFILNQSLFLALARGEADPVRRVLGTVPEIPETAQWATFLRNHDELDLGRLSASERQEVFDAFGPDPGMQLYARGIRRRLAPMLGGDQRRLKMAHSLMFALPGTPVLWYGEEIGMGENLELRERDAVRTPMQWDDTRNGGFSDAPAQDLVRPPPGGAFGPDRVNVLSQRDANGSLLDFVRRLIQTRRACPEIGWGRWTSPDLGAPGVLALRCDWQGRTVVTLHNLGDSEAEVVLGGSEDSEYLSLIAEDTAQTHYRPDEPVRLPPYGCRWLRLRRRGT
ncbi:alpha-amylase family protein [Arenibaculum pallidiluteum]|uniref:alpha-amylase family protein n=1 Tax=Arenibaculum pallidiluteum TaxID=2812559 RepID=UPI001A95AB09|nr:alpha-amylase family protein [Arenibaculum pallidiluteum]